MLMVASMVLLPLMGGWGLVTVSRAGRWAAHTLPWTFAPVTLKLLWVGRFLVSAGATWLFSEMV